MLKSGVRVQPNVLVAGNDPLLEALSEQLASADVKVTAVATERAVEKVWMAAPQVVIAIGDAVNDGGDWLRDALLAEPASAEIPLLLIRRGRSGREFKGTATIAPILGASRIARVIARIAREFLETPRAPDAQPLQRQISATLHCVEREVTFSGKQTSALASQAKQRRAAQASTPRRAHTQQSMAPPPVSPAEGGPQRGLAWTKPPNSISSQNLAAARVPTFAPVPAHEPPPRRPDSTGMDPNFGQVTAPPTDLRKPSRPNLEQTFVGMGSPDDMGFGGANSDEFNAVTQETPTLRPDPTPTPIADSLVTEELVANAIPTTPPAAPVSDAWEAEDAFADLGEELGTERTSGPSIETSGIRVLKNGGPPNPADVRKTKNSHSNVG